MYMGDVCDDSGIRVSVGIEEMEYWMRDAGITRIQGGSDNARLNERSKERRSKRFL